MDTVLRLDLFKGEKVDEACDEACMSPQLYRPPTEAELDAEILIRANAIRQDQRRFMAARAFNPSIPSL